MSTPGKTGAVTIFHPNQNLAAPSNILAFVRPDHHLDASYDRMLAKQETELRQALEKVQGLRRQCGETSPPAEGGVLPTLFAAREAAACRVASLTSRQREVMDMVLAGRASKIIAWELGISRRTVENHRAAVMTKTGSKSLPELARFAISAAWSANDGSNTERMARAVFPVESQGTGDAKPRARGNRDRVENKVRNALGGSNDAARDAVNR
jgi:DNA-binding CsgD family transcriptional regulator